MYFLNQELCSGCTSCAAACRKKAITMTPNNEGFLYPVLDETLCVHCGLCEKVCPVLNKTVQTKHTAVAAISENTDRLDSSSGGVFSLLASYIFQQGGTVFGPAFDENFQLRHIAVTDPAELPRLRGSKYLQSDVGDSYLQVKSALATGVPVLFTGTPCQINGLRSYLGKDYENLYCQDIICHGAPSPAVWKAYLAYRQQVAGSKVKSVNFRSKVKGWKAFSMVLEFENGTVYSNTLSDDPYMQAFLKDLSLRPSCYNCSAKGDRHLADITLGDYWGVDQLQPDMFDNKGTSLVVIHTEKGQRLIDRIMENLRISTEVPDEAFTRFNPAMNHSVQPPKNRKCFLSTVNKDNFPKAVQKNLPKQPMKKLKKIIKAILKR